MGVGSVGVHARQVLATAGILAQGVNGIGVVIPDPLHPGIRLGNIVAKFIDAFQPGPHNLIREIVFQVSDQLLKGEPLVLEHSTLNGPQGIGHDCHAGALDTGEIVLRATLCRANTLLETAFQRSAGDRGGVVLGVELFTLLQIRVQLAQLMLHLHLVGVQYVIHALHAGDRGCLDTDLSVRTKLAPLVERHFQGQGHVVHPGVGGTQGLARRRGLNTADGDIVPGILQGITDIHHGLDDGLVVKHGGRRTRAEVHPDDLIVECLGCVLVNTDVEVGLAHAQLIGELQQNETQFIGRIVALGVLTTDGNDFPAGHTAQHCAGSFRQYGNRFTKFHTESAKEFLGLLPGDDAICQVLLIVRIKELIYTTRAGRLPSSFLEYRDMY